MAVASRARTLMTMRADVERNGASGTDNYGHPAAPSFATHETIACRVWSRSRRQVIDDDKSVEVEEIRIAFPLDADVTHADRIAQITDRLGAVLWAGPLRILPLQHKHTHLEAALERVT